MRVKLIKIGNSTGIRLPKAVIKECGFSAEAEMTVQNGGILLMPVSEGRLLWQEMFQADIQQNPVREKGEWEW